MMMLFGNSYDLYGKVAREKVRESKNEEVTLRKSHRGRR